MIRGAAKEGLIKQRAGTKAARRVAGYPASLAVEAQRPACRAIAMG